MPGRPFCAQVLGREYPHQVGGLARALEIVGQRWTLLIVGEGMAGVSRFDDFHARLGISRKILSGRLGLLVEHGVMTKVPYQQRPVRYDYRLTPNGVALSPALQALTDWGQAYAQGDAEHPRGDRSRDNGAHGWQGDAREA